MSFLHFHNANIKQIYLFNAEYSFKIYYFLSSRWFIMDYDGNKKEINKSCMIENRSEK